MPANKRSAPSASISSAKKRKTDKENVRKWYAVRVGHNPGVYDTWPECQAQTAGFRGAQYKSFLTKEDAEAFVEGRPIPSLVGAKAEPKFYAVARGLFTGIFSDWEEASLAIAGTKGPKYKKFETREDAVAFIEQFGDEETIARVRGEDDDATEDVGTATTHGGFDSETGMMVIFTDGSSLGNGKEGSAAGVGVYFGPNDPRNVSERLEGEPQTNQRAELTAILRALEGTPATQPAQIQTDSQYSIKCVTIWYKTWEENGWVTTGQGDVKNKDLVQAIRAKIDEREAAGTRTELAWVKGHGDSPGNKAADQLAVAGAKKSLPAKGRRKLK